MSDDLDLPTEIEETEPKIDVEIIGSQGTGQGAPRLSDTGIAFYRTLLNDAAFVERYPSQAAALRASFDSAIAATGQDQPPAPDERSPAQQLADRHFGVTPHKPDDYQFDPPAGATTEVIQGAKQLAAALSLPPDLARVLVPEILSSQPDPRTVAEMFGERLPDMLQNAQAALDKAPVKIAATDLSPRALAMLADWSRHLARHATARS